MSNDLISVIVPVYKIEEIYLRRSIESILNQSYYNIELILIDDGSPDNCGVICDEYANNDLRVKVIHIDNGGVSNARNLGIKLSCGAYIIFVDGDDCINTSLIENLYKSICTSMTDCAICGCKHIMENEVVKTNEVVSNYETIILSNEEIIESLCYMKPPYSNIEITAIWGGLYKKEKIQNLKFDTKMEIGEDFWFKYQFFCGIKSAVFLNSQEYNYLIRSTSAMRNGFNINKINSIYQYENIIKDNNMKLINFEGVLSRVVNIAFVILFMIPINNGYKKERKILKDFIKKYRLLVLSNKKIRKKLKLALIISLVSIDFTQIIFEILGKMFFK